MGEIFLARFEGAAGFEKLCVVKRILPHLAEDARFRSMLIDEARIAASMSHPNICHVYELEETNNQLYIVMEYLEGVTLLALLRKVSKESRVLDFGLIQGIATQVCAGLHYAHELTTRDGERLGVVHCDVTPSNIFLTESGIVKVHDFGVAKAKSRTSTKSGTVKGKFAYMPPEQLQAGPIDRRTDVFAMGVVLGEMVTSRQLFHRKTEYLTFRAVMEEPLPDFRKLRPDVPDALVQVLERALARDPADRFETTRQLASAVVASLADVATPWGQVEISDFVKREFTEELRSHNLEIANVVSKTSGSIRTMPLILQNLSEPDETDYFAFETGVASEGELAPEVEERSEPRLRAMSMPIPTTTPEAAPAASIRGAVVAILGAAALVLALGIVLIGRRSESRDSSATPTPAPIANVRRSEIAAFGPYEDALQSRSAELATCATSAGDRTEGAPTEVQIAIGTDGRSRRISVASSTGSTPFTECIRRVLESVAFPPAADEKELSLAVDR